MSEPCLHPDFAGHIDVNRLTDGDDGPVIAYSADIRVECAICGKPFVFVGVPMGSSPYQPTVSVDGLELRAPIIEQGKKPVENPAKLPGFLIRGSA